MKLDLTEILARPGMRHNYEVDESPIVDEDLECVARLVGRIVLTNTGNVLLIDGRVSTTVAVPCSRCLVYYEEQAVAEISEQFPLHSTPVGPGGRQTRVTIEEEEDPAAGRLFEGPRLDLTELLRQCVTLALPSRPLHSDMCKGLCAQCGADLNDAPCDCVPPAEDQVVSRLGELIQKGLRC